MDNKEATRDAATPRSSFTELLGQLAEHSAAVVRGEIELAIQRIREKVIAVRSGVLTIVAGVVIGFAAFLSLCATLIIELSSYMPPVMAALVTGLALALIGLVIVFIGCKQQKKSNLVT